ncbi:uncharacterized protein [Diabrotica undecimpunctata]|uniref:uncharacterized protein n=1 Tax=Diabrotica undecimpunctata TaxID=50387 RepID=UPI003B637D40
MGNLPQARVSPAPPFITAGVDYAGPFQLKEIKGRGVKSWKAYLCLFICFTTKAVHLELVSDLTTEAFLVAFRRFCARRGKPSQIHSDNGTNFTGANNELKELSKFLYANENTLSESLNDIGVSWSFIPAYSPHIGSRYQVCKITP